MFHRPIRQYIYIYVPVGILWTHPQMLWPRIKQQAPPSLLPIAMASSLTPFPSKPYLQQYKLYACTGIKASHESPPGLPRARAPSCIQLLPSSQYIIIKPVQNTSKCPSMTSVISIKLQTLTSTYPPQKKQNHTLNFTNNPLQKMGLHLHLWPNSHFQAWTDWLLICLLGS